MSPTNPSRNPVPEPADLLAAYLRRQQEAHAAGLASAEPGGEVVLYEAGPVQPVDARVAWEEAVAVVRFLAAAQEPRGWQPPPHWPQLVSGHEPAATLPFCLGNFPQLVRHLHLLMHAEQLRDLCPTEAAPLRAPVLVEWANETLTKRRQPQALLAAGALRLARLFDDAQRVLDGQKAKMPAEWRAVWENERAALAWHRGRLEEARTLWEGQAESVPVLFNRGLAALFLDRAAEARPLLAAAVAKIPEESAWHHLGQLYLTLAQTRG
jgi:hypothetical protein